jgi:hypothetical protein
VTQLQEAILWAALCFNPQGFEVYDPIHAQNYRITRHYQIYGFTIAHGMDVHITGNNPDWVVLKYRKNALAPLEPDYRTVTHHWPDGSMKWGDE